MKRSRVGFTDNMSNKIDGFSSCSEFQGVKGFKSILPCSAPGRDQFCGAGRGGAGQDWLFSGRGGAGQRGKPSFKKNLFCEKVSQTGGGGHLDFIPLFFLQYNVKAPKYSPQKRISFHKTPTGGGGHRFMKLFRKIDFF